MNVSRTCREDGPGRVFHVTARVNWQQWHFRDEATKSVIAEMLREAAESFGVRLLAWVLMSNHLHVVAQSPPDALYLQLTSRRTACRHLRPFPDGHQKCTVLAQFMRRLRHRTSIRRHAQLGVKGRFWDSTYDSRLIEDPLSLAVRVAYDHRNPVKAHMVERPEEYVWSSAAQWATGREGQVPISLALPLPFGLSEAELRERVLGYHSSSGLDALGDELDAAFELPPRECRAALQRLLAEHGLL